MQMRIKARLRDRMREFDVDRIDVLMARIRLAIVNGNIELARRLFEELLADNVTEVVDMDSSISELGLPVKQVNFLERAGFETVRSVAMASDKDLLTVRQISKESIRMIRSRLVELGLCKPNVVVDGLVLSALD